MLRKGETEELHFTFFFWIALANIEIESLSVYWINCFQCWFSKGALIWVPEKRFTNIYESISYIGEHTSFEEISVVKQALMWMPVADLTHLDC